MYLKFTLLNYCFSQIYMRKNLVWNKINSNEYIPLVQTNLENNIHSEKSKHQTASRSIDAAINK